MSARPFEELPALSPLHFFNLTAEVGFAKEAPSMRVLMRSHRLPCMAELLSETPFAQVALNWGIEGVSIGVVVEKPFEEAYYPEWSQGDALELFFDTRDLKGAGFLTRFCHHFLILPQEVQGIRALELTRFRTEDSHPLCDPLEIGVATEFFGSSYQLHIFLPAHCLHGYDPSVFDRLGFTYRIHRKGGNPQHFAVPSSDFCIEQSPRLWGSLKLIKS